MTAFNIVRFHVKPGREQEFVAAHRNMGAGGFKGARQFALVRTGDSSFCAIGEWESFDNIIDARPMMLGMLDSFRDMLEDIGGGHGVTDPVSGEAVVLMRPKSSRKAAAKKRPAKNAAAKKAAKKPAKKSAKKKPAKRAQKK